MSSKNFNEDVFEIKNKIAKEVDELANNLITEFYSHYNEVSERENSVMDQSKVFEGWVVQKIAGLQLMIYRFNDEIEQMRKELNKISKLSK